MATYNQYESAPSGLSYLTGDIKPWEDYVILRTDEDTSIAVYGTRQEDMIWENATVRKVERVTSSGYNSYYETSESLVGTAVVNVTNPYYAYGNVIGVSYDLPSTNAISCIAITAAVIVCVLVSIFRLVFSLKRGIR